MPSRVVIARDEAGMRALGKPWAQLMQLPGVTATPFSSFEWCSSWWTHFGRGAPPSRATSPFVIALFDGAQLIGMAPFMLRRVGPVRKLEFLGAGLADSADVMLAPRHADHALALLSRVLSASKGEWDLGDLSEVPPFSALLSGSFRSSNALRLVRKPQTICPVISLPGTWEEYVSSLPRKRRYYVASFPRKFLREHDGQLSVVTGHAEAGHAVETFYRLHMARWEGKEERLSADHTDPGFLPFLSEACSRMAGEGWLRIVQLRAGDSVVASSINFMCNGRWHAYMKGFEPSWGHARPGTVLDALRIKQAIEEGATVFDFGRGEEAYKEGFGTESYRNTRLLISSGTLRSRGAIAVMLMRYRLREKAYFMAGDQEARHLH